MRSPACSKKAPGQGSKARTARSSAAPARQERCVHVEAAETRRLEDSTRQDQAVSDDYRRIEMERGESLDRLGIEFFRRAHGESRALGRVVHRRQLRALAAAGGTR